MYLDTVSFALSLMPNNAVRFLLYSPVDCTFLINLSPGGSNGFFAKGRESAVIV